ncbi:restriction endonuclease subunit S [Ilyobacter polytropus]|uniref:Restriction modification system DNA specificity domain protein n=1 Tax=Ilyobacter polytropus (strain ATCC 51220 / DSM 2926 / LMG 16218 / CuHBu1) TaxID=572544 RepID=E3H8C4_ILYPC|nr:restriction endonuclease subunit S [Ilyobacter polytropus]ADO82691.1 restriction modification system DNA specificity domain protein [Ilyobacter polytropus DSM 2926]
MNDNKPIEWIKVPLIECVGIYDRYRKPISKIERDKRVSGKNCNDLFKYYGATGLAGYIDDYLLEGEYVILGEDGAPFLDSLKSKSYLVSGKFWVNNHAHILKSYFNNKFLLHYLNQFNYKNYVSGTTRLKLNQTSMKKIPIIVPPLAEQEEVVSRIESLFSELDNGIENLKRAQKQLKLYRQSILRDAFEGKLTEEWRRSNPDKVEDPEVLVEKIKEARVEYYENQLEEWKERVEEWKSRGEVGKKPSRPSKLKEFTLSTNKMKNIQGWTWMAFGNTFTESPQNGIYKPANLYGEGTKIIRIDNFYDGVINSKKTFKSLKLTEEEVEKYKLTNNNILINRVNSIDYLGKCGLCQNIDESTVFESNIMKITVDNKNIVSKFITLYLTSRIGISELRKNAKHAVNQASINQTDVSNVLAPICSLDEQNEVIKIVEEKLSICENLERTLRSSLKRSELLRQSILNKAFSGKLTKEWRKENQGLITGENSAENLLKKTKEEKEG